MSPHQPRAGGFVVVELRGRLGNHLFQWATARQLIADTDPVVVDCTRASMATLQELLVPGAVRALRRREYARLLRPPPLGVDGSLLSVASRAALGTLEGSPFGGPMRHRTYVENRGRASKEPPLLGFDRDLPHAVPPLLLRGYFQDERYFSDDFSRIVGSLRHPSVAASALLPASHGRSTAAMIVRSGGDYERLGWLTPIDWYLEAARALVERVGEVEFLVFSDVGHVASLMARSLDPLGPATPVLGFRPTDQLLAASMLDHAIIAPSSFAWWGAWFGDARADFDEDRVVVAPDPWLEHPVSPVPSRWTKLPHPRH